MAKLPAKIGKYKVVDQIASGGMGAVYKAEHPTLSRYVIIKKLTLRGDAAVRERFRREAQIMMDFTSDYIVNVYDHFREGSSYYIVLEYVDGPSLETLLRRERYLPEYLALRVFRASCRALQYAHERGVVHRDIKPGNILISTDGHVKLVDFGIASIHGGESEENLTREGMTLGTPSYMPPEQYEDSRNVDKRADIYAMGVMLYEMTTGKKPFSNSLNAEAIRKIQQGKYTRPRKHNPKITPATQRLIRRCMKVKPERRFQSMAAVLERLDKVVGRRDRSNDVQLVADYLAGTGVAPKGPNRRRRALIAVAALLLLGLAGAAGYGYYEGYHYEYLYPDEYGALQVSVRVPRGGKSPVDLSVRGQLFVDDGDEIPPLEEGELRFAADPLQSNERFLVFRARKRYIPAGAYRLKVMAEQDLVWHSFFLRPRTLQQQTPELGEARQLTIDAGPAGELPLDLSLRLRNRASGAALQAPVETRIRGGGGWLELTPERREELRTGTVHRFRFEAEGFYPEEYSLRVESYQSDLTLEAELTPYPGALVLRGDLRDVRVLVNGTRSYLRGGRDAEITPVPQPGTPATATQADEDVDAVAETGGPVELILLPGSHGITLRRGDASVTREFRLESLQRAEVRVRYDGAEESLSFGELRRQEDPGLAAP